MTNKECQKIFEQEVMTEDEFDADERLRDEIEARNNSLLDIFAADLRSQRMSGKMWPRHEAISPSSLAGSADPNPVHHRNIAVNCWLPS